MNTDTTIAKNIRVADEKASYDAACKRLLSEKIILAWIMKNCLEEYRDCDVEEIAEKYIKGTPRNRENSIARYCIAEENLVGVEEKGIQKGIDKGITAMILTLKELQILSDVILKQICEKFGLTEENAETYLKEIC